MKTKFKCELRSQAHHLKPVIIIGNAGLTKAVHLEIERALLDHELIKIKVNASDNNALKNMIEQMCKTHDAELIQSIGHMVVIYRKKPENIK